jgi:RNA polymerase sigma-70 factor (ECF subfamily)
MLSLRRSEAALGLDSDSQAWLDALHADDARRDDATARLHALLLGAARSEVARRRSTMPHVGRAEFEDIAQQSADDALVAVLGKLDQFRGESRFTTWAYKFALLEAAVNLRRRRWLGREVCVEPERWPDPGDGGLSSHEQAERAELLAAVRRAIDEELSSHQREVLVAVALNGVPIDVLAERLGTTRGALYKTIHDARVALRRKIDAAGLSAEPHAPGEQR